ncbi:hypothetical protein DCC85_16340 [Paenibacillus sp. CAA11]|uniref:hypothetical protein n=1 Tax=Paenibacillus sp. CAA11 TaxID=1532905 RepID=UPI000D3D6878|nr:hypothetical protein [Paenibacillus sp. CAA11]AWB45608.1 hypothetical protein DCC85_16340 [Paenibacillus sp. CAA11]
MRKYNLSKAVIAALLAALFLLGNGTELRAHAAADFDLNMNPKQVKQWSNGPKVTVNPKGEAGTVQVHVSTRHLAKGSYSAYVFENRQRNWNNYGEISFNLANGSDQPLKMNVVATLQDGTGLTIPIGGMALLETAGQERLEAIFNTYGSLELKGHFQGTVHVPFASLLPQGPSASERENPSQLIAAIASWGITTSLEEKAEQSFRFGNIRGIPKAEARADNEIARVRVNGELEVQKPVQGESIAGYSPKGLPDKLTASFRLAKPEQDASLTADGKLTLKAGVTAGQLSMRMDVGSRWSFPFEVKLVPSWTLKRTEKDGTSLSLPTPDKLSPLTRESDPWLHGGLKSFIRIGSVLSLALVLILYVFWRRKSQDRSGF